jgi:hypothetical protein
MLATDFDPLTKHDIASNEQRTARRPFRNSLIDRVCVDLDQSRNEDGARKRRQKNERGIGA